MSTKANVFIDGAEFQEIDTSPRTDWTPEYNEVDETIFNTDSVELFFSLSPQTLNELQDYCIQSGISTQAAVEQAVSAWIQSRTQTRSSSDQ